MTMKQKHEDKQTRIDENSTVLVPEYDHINSRLKDLVEVNYLNVDLPFTFSLAFAEIFTRETPNYEISAGKFGATRSNWTYHTAMAISQTCKILDLTCKFETLGKRDAVIETRGEKPEIILVAEWEWDYEDIFGKGKEIDKLIDSCKSSKTAEAFLLVYCPISKYLDHLQRIAEAWIKSMKEQKDPPALFVHTIIFKEQAGYREFDILRTVEISPMGVNVWNDRYF